MLVDCDGLRLDTSDTAEQKDGSVEDSEGSFDFDSEIDVTGSIDEIDMVVFPHEMGGGRLNGDTFLLFEFHEVHGGTDTVRAFDFVDGWDFAGIEKYSFGEGGFSGVDMCWDTDVSNFIVVGDGEGGKGFIEQIPGECAEGMFSESKHTELKLYELSV